MSKVNPAAEKTSIVQSSPDKSIINEDQEISEKRQLNDGSRQIKQPRYSKTKYDLDRKDVLEVIVHYIKVFLKMLPSILGIVDEITDFYYYASQPFAHESLREAFLFYIVFTPFLQTLIWDAYFSIMAYATEDKTQYDDRRRQYFQNELLKKKMVDTNTNKGMNFKVVQIKSFAMLVYMYIREGLSFGYYMVYYSLLSLIYAVLQEFKILPFYITFFDPILRKVSYPITRELIEEFKSKEIMFNAILDIQKQNKRVDQINYDIMLYNSEKNQNLPTKPLRERIVEPKLYSTDALKSAEILKLEKSVSNQLLFDPYIENFLMVGELVEAVFESLPMLTLQYVNNGILDLWGSYFNIFSFVFSLLMITINCFKMTYSISESETFPLMKFKNFIAHKLAEGSDERVHDPVWILQHNKDSVYTIYDMDSMKKAAEANSTFYETISKIKFDISSDPDFLLKCLEGDLYPAYCISNIMKSMNKQNQIQIMMGDNEAVKPAHLEVIFNSFAGASFYTFQMQLRHTRLGTSSYLEGLGYGKFLRHVELDLSFTGMNDIKGLKSIENLLKLEYLDLKLSANYFDDASSLQALRALTKLKTLKLDLSHNKIDITEPLAAIANLRLLENLQINLKENKIDDLTFISKFDSLPLLITLNIDLSSQYLEDLSSLQALGRLSMIRSLRLNLENNKGIKDISKLSFLGNLKQLQELDLNLYSTDLDNISVLDCLVNLTSMVKLALRINYNRIYDVTPLENIKLMRNLTSLILKADDNYLEDIPFIACLESLTRLTYLELSLSKNKIPSIDKICFERLSNIQDLRLNFEKNQIDDITKIGQIFDLVTLKSLKLQLGKNNFQDYSVLSRISQLIDLEEFTLDLWNIGVLKEIPFIQSFEHLIDLRKLNLNLGCNQLHDVETFSILANLEHLESLILEFSANSIENAEFIKSFSKLTNLTTLELGFSQNYISDISYIGPLLKSFPNLIVLRVDLRYMKFLDLEQIFEGSLEGKSKLQVLMLNFGTNSVGSLEFMRVLIKCRSLFDFYFEVIYKSQQLQLYTKTSLPNYLAPEQLSI